MKILNYNASKIILYSVLVISIFILLYTSSVSYKKIFSFTESEKILIHTHQVNTQLEKLASLVNEAESNQRGFTLTHDSSYIGSYNKAKANVIASYTMLKDLVADNSLQQNNIKILHDLIDERFYYLEKNLNFKRDTILSIENLKMRMTNGKKSMDRLLAKIEVMKAVEMKLLEKREIDHKEKINLSPLWVLLSTLFSIFIFICSFYKINRDLQNIKKANNQLMINKEIFEHTEQIAEISSWCLNLENNSLTFSHNQFRMLGCEIHEFEPTTEKYLQFVHPDDRNIVQEGRQKILYDNSGTPLITYFRIIRKDKSLRYFKSIEKKILDNYNNNILIGINMDITEQYLKDKIIEEKIFDLERSNNELSAFNHVASHDLQEPLRKVQTYISRIRDKDFETLSEKGREYFVRVQIAANRMQKLIDDLLLFSRTNKADKVFEPANLNEIFENTKTELAQAIEEKNAVVSSEQLPVILAIPFQIQQLFNNIIGNSLKYATTGIPPVIRVSSRIVNAAEIPLLRHLGETRFHELTFTDNGIGFEQQYAENIFKLFQRLHDDSSYTGTGIGLTICKKIVENHKGLIRAYGTPGGGATFRVYLPI